MEVENAELRREVDAQRAKIQSLEQKLFILFGRIGRIERADGAGPGD
jgi:hypothetical protein